MANEVFLTGKAYKNIENKLWWRSLQVGSRFQTSQIISNFICQNGLFCELSAYFEQDKGILCQLKVVVVSLHVLDNSKLTGFQVFFW